MEKNMTTREKIIYESLKLFSVNGFAAVSVRTIAANVGVRDSALYKHFKNKQAIFDAIVEESKRRMMQQYTDVGVSNTKWDDLQELCRQMFEFQTKDQWITMFRRMLLLEQYKNPEAAATYKMFFVDLPIDGQEQIFKQLIEHGVMKDHNARVMAVELYAPFFMYHLIEEDQDKLQKIFDQHVKNFVEHNREYK